jgi:hypothetical protein
VSTDPASPPPAKEEKPKTLGERIFTSTPVALAVIATILTGQSSSEMSRAQYFRSLAAQHQSRVSDQWNFFQAKRQRGDNRDLSLDQLQSLSQTGTANPAAFQAALARFPKELDEAEKQAARFESAVMAARGELGTVADPLQSAATELKKSAAESRQAWDKLNADLTSEKVKEALPFLSGKDLPTAEGEQPGDPRKTLREPLARINTLIPEALDQIAERKTERQMAPILADIRAEQAQEAVELVEGKAADFDKATSPVTNVFRSLNSLVATQAAAGQRYQQAAHETALVLATAPQSDKGLTELRAALAGVARAGNDLKRSSDGLVQGFAVGQLDFNTRRYDREARYNQTSAGLGELEVRIASLASERHRERSQYFLFASLAAQAGVTISTLALAVRRRSLLWIVAAVAGLGALVISAWIYSEDVGLRKRVPPPPSASAREPRP